MKANNTPSNLKGMAKHTYNRVMSAMAEDSDPAMLHTFAALTEGAKAIALQSGNFSNPYIRGINKGMTAEEAANELTERAAALVSRKLRKIDMICAAAFLAEYISRQRKEAEQPEPTNPDNTPSTMNANEINAPEFSELSHTATNIVLTAENDGNIYRRHVQPLILSLVNKIKRGIKPDRKRLAQSAAMRTIIANSLAEMYCAGWMEDNTRVKATERKEAANYLAWSYISDAEDEYDNQMAAYK